MDKRAFLAGAIGIGVGMGVAEIRNAAEFVKQQCDELDAVYSGVARFTYPPRNYVFQRNTDGKASFQATWRGAAGMARLKSGETLVQESASGTFTDIPSGWYEISLDDVDSIKIGVGEHYVAVGQSNSYDPREEGYTAFATTPGRCVIGVPSLDIENPRIDYFDTHYEEPILGMMWIHAMNTLARPFPTCITLAGKGASSVQQWNTYPFRQRMLRAIAGNNPRLVWWSQGEANVEYSSLVNEMYNVIQTMRAATDKLIVVCLNEYPSGGDWPIEAAQRSVITSMGGPFPNVALGINQCIDGDWGVPRVREENEVHYLGNRHQVAGEAIAHRILNGLIGY